MHQIITVVDSFTTIPYSGNPAAVCVLDRPADDAWLRAVAREMNLSETAFLHHESRSGPHPTFHLRWFTPLIEVDLCGHATLAAAHVLWESGRVPGNDRIRFLTRSGALSASRSSRGITLDFPAIPPEPIAPIAGLDDAIGAPILGTLCAGPDILVEIASPQALRELKPHAPAIEALRVRGLIVTAPSDEPGFDFLSRFFAPSSGVPEDPVTGSAHCALGPFWAQRLNRNTLTGYQASPRGGTVSVEIKDDRALLTGHAVTILEGKLCFGPG
jgi:PhzF family phenazine biosynthesis protein